jgi:hypothetical protein
LAELTQSSSSFPVLDLSHHVPRVPDFMGTNFAKFHPTTEVIGCDFKEFPAINPGQMQDIQKLWLMGFICLPTSSSAVNPAICLVSLKLRQQGSYFKKDN